MGNNLLKTGNRKNFYWYSIAVCFPCMICNCNPDYCFPEPPEGPGEGGYSGGNNSGSSGNPCSGCGYNGNLSNSCP